MLIDWEYKEISVNRQCELLGLSKGGLYYKAVPESLYNLELMDEIDKQYMDTPYYGSRRMAEALKRKGYKINRKKAQRLMKKMGLEAIYPGPNLSKRQHMARKYPYLLTDLEIKEPNFVWSSDITYIRLKNGFMYLVAIIDLFSRYVLSWKLSNSLEVDFCIEATENALSKSVRKPEIFNTDQGSQFTSDEFTNLISSNGIKLSMDGKGRAFDNIFIERLWRSLKYEEVYLKAYETVVEARLSIDEYFYRYNNKRPHQSLDYKYPVEVHCGEKEKLI